MLKKSPLIIISLGSQATSWAQNLRDSGREVIIACRENGRSLIRAQKLGFETILLRDERLREYEHFFLLIPDSEHGNFYKENLKFIKEGSCIYYAHGHSLTAGKYDEVYSDYNHILLAPKAIASEVRHQYQTDGKLGAAFSVLQSTGQDLEKLTDWVKTLAEDLGITSIFKSSFKEETYADLFSEQTLLCSLLPYGALHSFNHLIDKGISPEIAYMECWLEVKLIATAMVKLGPMEFFELISPNALIGGEKAQKIIFDEKYKETLTKLSTDIWNQNFFTECEEIDSTKLRSDVLRRWSNEKLTKVFEEVGNKLN